MFVYRELYSIATPRQADYEKRVLGLHARIAQEPTCAGGLLLKFQGNAGAYRAFRLWDTKEASQEWGRHPDMAAYLASRPPGNYLAPPQMDYWDEDARHAGVSGPVGFAVQEECLLAGGKQRDFETWNQEWAEVCAALPGFVERRVMHYLGGPGRFLTLAV
ncbi:MAG: hypothetical protein NTZ05_17555, partial [Chloroflexi bacterium]|nr:hypothetical protein [Chloroflexota bacterium]